MWMTWSQPRTRCSAAPEAALRCGTYCVLNMYGQSAAREIGGPLKPVPSPSRSLAPPSRPHRWASLDGGRPALLYEGVCCAAQKMAVPLKQRNGVANSAGGRRGWPRSIEHTHTHACWLQREQKKKSKSCRTQTAHPVKDRLASVGCVASGRVPLVPLCTPTPGCVPGAPGRLIERRGAFLLRAATTSRPFFVKAPVCYLSCRVTRENVAVSFFWCRWGKYRRGLGRSASVR